MYQVVYSDDFLAHHGILGQKWGVRRYQNPDGTLTKAGKRHIAKLDKKDKRWANKNYDKIYSKAYRRSEKAIHEYMDNDLKEKYAEQIRQKKIGRNYINDLNKKYAEIMNMNATDLKAPSGRAVKFVAKRGGEIGVFMALADQNYDMNQVKNGIYDTGKIAYKKKQVNMG